MTLSWGMISPGVRLVEGAPAPEPKPSWTLDTARNALVFAQVLVESDEPAVVTWGSGLVFDWSGKLPRLRLAVRWSDAAGAAPLHEPASVQLRWVGYIPDDHGSRSADPLLTQESVTLEPGKPRAVWLTLRTHPGTRPGKYRLTVDLFRQQGWEREELVGSCDVALHVRPVTLPDPQEYTFHLDLWQHPTRWADHYQVPRWSERHWRIIEAYARELAKAGQKAITVIASDAPWAGQGCWNVPEYPFAFYEFNMIRAVRTREGKLRCYFDVVDRYVETFLAAGVDAEIEVIGLLGVWHDVFGTPLTAYPDPVRVRVYDEAQGRYDFIRTKDELADYVAQFATHLRARGWFERTRITSDEPGDLERFKTCLAFLRSVEPDFRFKIACNHAPFIDAFKDDVLDWVPNLASLTHDPELSRRLNREVHARGGRMSWYICLRPEYPNTFFHSPLHETRLLGWLTHWFGLDGFLRWAFAAWAPDPWNRPAWKFPGGDLLFVYPGPDGTPLPSLRWEMLQLAVQEFELLRMAERDIATVPDPQAKARYADRLAAIIRQVIRVEQPGDFRVDAKAPEELYATDYAAYDAARSELLTLLEELANR